MFDPELGDRFIGGTGFVWGNGAGVKGVESGILCGGLLVCGGCGFLLQSRRGCGWTGATVRLFRLPLGSVVGGGAATGGLEGVGGGTRRGGCGEERRGGAGGGTGSGVGATVAVVR